MSAGEWRVQRSERRNGDYQLWAVFIGDDWTADFALEEDARACVEAVNARGWRSMESDAARDVLAERRRQVEAEGWTPEHDDKHDRAELSTAAACYALLYPKCGRWRFELIKERLWPWQPSWWKPHGQRRNLVKAGALILAEIERLDRAAAKRTQP